MSEKMLFDLLTRIDDRTEKDSAAIHRIEEKLNHVVTKEECLLVQKKDAEKEAATKPEGGGAMIRVLSKNRKVFIPVGAILAAMAAAAVAILQAL